MQIILGSQSPRRQEILSFFSLPFLQVPSGFAEETIQFQGDPKKHCLLLSQKKAEVLSQKYHQEIILTADTVVFFKDRLFEKPTSREEACSFLRQLGGVWHEVCTGVSVAKGGKLFSGVEGTRLLFHKLTEAQIEKFLSHCYFWDKAGGYAIEKSGNLIVDKMEGCYYNVLGLPVHLTQKLLLNVGIDLWDFLKAF